MPPRAIQSAGLRLISGGLELEEEPPWSGAWDSTLALVKDGWPLTGWLDNQQNKDFELAKLRRTLDAQVADLTARSERAQTIRERNQWNVALEKVNAQILELRKQDRIFQVELPRGSAGDGEEEDAGPGLVSDAAQDSARKKKKKKTESLPPKPMERPHLPAPANPKEFEPGFDLLFDLMHEGLEMSKLPKDRYSTHACQDHVPELEDDTGPAPIKLRPHQKEVLGRWEYIVALKRVFLFSDDTGLGKTAVAVARIKRTKDREEIHGSSHKSFLVVIPSSLLSVWKMELARCPSIKVCEYYKGLSREYTKAELLTYDVVLTTYGVVAGEYKKIKQVERDWHDIHQGREREILRDHARVLKAAPNTKIPPLMKSRIPVPVLSIEWFEIIVDEIHTIKNRKSKTGEALCALLATSRVGITGTPMQNDYHDLFSIFRFFRLEPLDRLKFFDVCFVQKTNKAGRRAKRMNTDSSLILAAVLAGFQVRRMKLDFFEGEPLTGLVHSHELRQKIPLCKEAQKTQEATRALWDHVGEAKKSREQQREARRRKPNSSQVKRDRDEEESKDNCEILRLIFEARADCIHPLIKTAKYGEDGTARVEGQAETRENLSLITGRAEAREDIDYAAQAEAAAIQHTAIDEDYAVPARGRRTEEFETNRRRFRALIDATPDAWCSDKLLVVVTTIGDVLEEQREIAAKLPTLQEQKEYISREKIIVFCEYLSAHDVLETALRKELGIEVARYDGQCAQDERDQTVARFEELGKDFAQPSQQPDEQMVLLATSKSAAEGLTLVHARHVMFLAACWNPYIEEQAIGRAYRMGQKGQVWIYTFLMKQSLELRVAEIGVVKRDRVSKVQDFAKLAQERERMSRWGKVHFERQVSIPCLTSPTSLTDIFV